MKEKKVKFIDGFVELVNDYRDTIYYSTGLILTLVLLIFCPNKTISFDIAYDFVWVREVARWISWTVTAEPRARGYQIVLGWFVLTLTGLVTLIVGCVNLHDAPKSAVFNVCVGLFKVAYGYSYWRKIEPNPWYKNIYYMFKLYRLGLWDWPRKQKPPRNRLKEAKDAIAKLMQKIADAVTPSPLPQPARIRI